MPTDGPPDTTSRSRFAFEEKIGLAAAARLPELRVNGKSRRREQILSWCRRGVRGIKLESTQIGAQYVTSAAAVRRWLVALNAEPPGPAAGTEAWVKHALSEARI